MRRRMATIWAIAVTTALVCGGWLAGPVAAQDAATPAATPAECPALTPADGEMLILRFYEAINAGSIDDLAPLMAGDVVLHTPAGTALMGYDNVAAQILAGRGVNWPDLQTTVEEIVVEGDLIAVRTLSTGTHSDSLEEVFPGLDTAATGRQVTWSAQAWFRVACGEVEEIWRSTDRLGILRQIGAIPAGLDDDAPEAATSVDAAGSIATPAACPATTLDENKAIVSRLIDEVFTARVTDPIDELHAEGHRHHEGQRGPIIGDEAVEARFAERFANFPRADVTIEALIAEGDLVAVRWRSETELAVGADFFGIQGSGQAVTLSGMSIFQIACGEIAATWTIIDLVGVLTQLGWPEAAATPAA